MQVEQVLGKGRPEKAADLDEAVRASGRSRKAVEALAHLETLDGRILAALKKGKKTDRPADPIAYRPTPVPPSSFGIPRGGA